MKQSGTCLTQALLLSTSEKMEVVLWLLVLKWKGYQIRRKCLSFLNLGIEIDPSIQLIQMLSLQGLMQFSRCVLQTLVYNFLLVFAERLAKLVDWQR